MSFFAQLGNEVNLIVFLLRIVGVLIIVSVLVFAWTLFVNASRFEEEIEAESGDSGEE